MLYKTIGALALGVCVAVPQGAFAQAPDSLRLAAVYRELRTRNPRLQSAAALADAVRTKESAAGLLPDPHIQLGVMNLSLPDFSADMPSSMAPSVTAMQMLPFPGKLSLGRTIATQSTAIAASEADETWWVVRSRTAIAFFELYQAERQLAVMIETLELLRRFHKIAQAMYSAGEGRQADVLRASVEIARMQADSARMQTMRTVATARLNALLDRPADARFGPAVHTIADVDVSDSDMVRGWAAASRPMLSAARTRLEQARTREALARREIWPDLTLGVQYGRRSAEMGTENMGSLMFGFSVPIFAKQRQLRMRDEAGALARMAEADLAETRATVSGRITELVAEIERARTLMTLFTSDVLPQAEATVASAFASYRVGSVDFMTLVDAQMTTNAYRQELVALEAQHGSAVAELEMTVGRELTIARPSARR